MLIFVYLHGTRIVSVTRRIRQAARVYLCLNGNLMIHKLKGRALRLGLHRRGVVSFENFKGISRTSRVMALVYYVGCTNDMRSVWS